MLEPGVEGLDVPRNTGPCGALVEMGIGSRKGSEPSEPPEPSEPLEPLSLGALGALIVATWTLL